MTLSTQNGEDHGLPNIARWAILIGALLLTLGLPVSNQAEAAIERIYTLPFYDSFQISGGFIEGSHFGIDYVVGTSGVGGEEIVAAAGGTAKPCDFSFTAGNYIVLNHGNGHRTRYLHLIDDPLPSEGEYVGRGEIIGYEGNTGDSTGPHLHFETRHAATTFTCGSDGTAVDPYASSTYMWTTNPPSYATGTDTLGWWRSGDRSWHLRNDFNNGSCHICVQYGEQTSIPVVGDWDGDGVDTIGWYRPSDQSWHLRNDFNDGSCHICVVFASSSSDIPVVGDWDGDGDDTIGWYRPSDQSWHLRNDFNGGSCHICVIFASSSSDKPVTGDWDGDGDGVDTIGWWRPSDSSWHLRNDFNGGSCHICVVFGQQTSTPVVGDWDEDGVDTIGWWRSSDKSWHLRNDFNSGSCHICVVFGQKKSTPVTGDWDGQ